MKKILMILTIAFLLVALPSFSQVAVDLGLPSGTKWADRNVGASSPSGYGNYYDEEQAKSIARAKWGGTWCTPTKAQCEELVSKCRSEWSSVNGVKGCKFTGPNGKSIFLPAAGIWFEEDSQADYVGSFLQYMTSSIDKEYDALYYLTGNYDEQDVSIISLEQYGDGTRCSVRPVRK